MTVKCLRVWCLLVILAGCATAEDSDTDMMQPTSEQPAMAASDSGEAAAPAPPASEPATPAMPISYAVYFANASWLMGDAEESTIDDAVAAAHSLGAATFVVEGFSDSTGSDRQNMRYSKLRAEAVADALVARGILQEQIQLSWHGAQDAGGEASAGAAEPDSRRVTIELR